MIDKQLKNEKDCMGCHACSSICPKACISLESNEEGFLYPVVNYDECIECGLCIKVCPIINRTVIDNNPSSLACINNDEGIRLDSSSGGIFTLIAENIINKGGVVFGAAFNDEFEVEHTSIETEEELWKLRGSKYVQSKIGDSYKLTKKFLDSERDVVFTGTPCQIAGLKNYLEKPYSRLITLDIICHGVPSPKVWQKYVQLREDKAGSPTQRIAFRCKDEGWRKFSVSFLFRNKEKYRENLRNDFYLRAFLKDICLRPSCYDCKFKGINRQSDITLGDFWGIQEILPEMDDDKGASLIFLNSDIGRLLFDEIKDRMIYQEVDIQEATKYNSASVASVICNPKRNKFMANMDNMTFDKLVKKYCDDSLSLIIKRKTKSAIKRILGK